MTKPPGAPNPFDIQRKMVEAAQLEVLEAERKAAKFSAIGTASDGSGDLILTGKTPMGLTVVGIRLTTIQALAICANVCQSLSGAMMAAEQNAARALAKPTAVE